MPTSQKNKTNATRTVSRNELERYRILERVDGRKIDARYGLFREICRGSVFLGVAFLCYLSIRVIAGTNTSFKAVLDASIAFSLDKWAAYALAGTTSAAWLVERRTRQRTILKFERQAREWERQVDPGRSSSNLLPNGKPRKEDCDAP